MKRPIRAFTLVELLVVIGIIAVLISILLPSLSRARQQAVSAQCMSNMRQVGMAALMYANANKGWLPPTPAASPNSPTDERFLLWDNAPNAPDQFTVSVSMAQYAGYKFRPWEGASDSTYVSPNTPLFDCPADEQPVSGVVWPDNNLLNHNTALVAGNGLSLGKFRYWWVANPYYFPSETNQVNTAYQGNVDLLAAQIFAHMDINPLQDPAGPAWFDRSVPCKPGVDYLRSTKDKHVSDIAIMTDRSKQQSGVVIAGQTGVGYMMHGSVGPNSKKGWKNELFGDGHCESRRLDQMRQRWSVTNPQAW